METYSLLREFADSWVLLAMFAFFLGAAIWAFLPSQAKARTDASMIPFRNETADCSGKCTNCTSAKTVNELKGLPNDQ
jgi:cytochrome c oxidase cbb3-type subunit 4